MKKAKYLLMVAPLLLLSSCGDNDVNYSEPKFDSYKNAVTYEVYNTNYNERLALNKFSTEDFTGSFTSNASFKTMTSEVTTRSEEKIAESSEIMVNEGAIKYDDNSRASNVAMKIKQKTTSFELDYDEGTTQSKVTNDTASGEMFVQDIEVGGKNLGAKINKKEKSYSVLDESTYSNAFSMAAELMELSFIGLDDYDDISEEDKQYYKYYVDSDVLTIVYEQTKKTDILSSSTYIIGNKTTTYKNVHQVIIKNESIKFISAYSRVSETKYIANNDDYKLDEIVNREYKASFEGDIKLDNVTVNKIDITDYNKK